MLSSIEYINFVLPFKLTHQFGCIPSSAVDLLDAPADCGVVVLLPGDLLDTPADCGMVVL